MPENTEYEKKDVLELNDQQKDFTYQFHKEVNNVIGGDNPNQKLILLLPGIALTMEDFEYDYTVRQSQLDLIPTAPQGGHHACPRDGHAKSAAGAQYFPEDRLDLG